MRDDIEYLLSISDASREFDARAFVHDVLKYELDSVKQASIFSLLHTHVVENGYPIPASQISESSYINRPKLEESVNSALNAGRNLYLIGCEGGGKTTLLHYVISVNFQKYHSFFGYTDISDAGLGIGNFSDVFFEKIRNSLFLSITPTHMNDFDTWIKQFSENSFAKELINTSTTKNFVESLLIFISTRSDVSHSYIIIDNVDSLRANVVEDFFALLHRLESTVSNAFRRTNLRRHSPLRFIVCCRTQSLNIITSASFGLFSKSPFDTINMDERFTTSTDILDLTKQFLRREYDYISRLDRPSRPSKIRAGVSFGSVGWDSFQDYCEDVFNWLALSRKDVNETVSKFCGRSIRRSKLFLVKTLGSPIIARLVFFEKNKVFNVTRSEPEYLRRRMLEAVFDFTIYSGYPLNPFRVLTDGRSFRDNPFIGVVALLFMAENLEELRSDDVNYAQAIDARRIVKYLRTMKYENSAIVQCFQSFVACGLLRPINGLTSIITDDHVDGNVTESYILDQYALTAYVDLILFKKWIHSLTFYNMSLRARYNVRADRHLDNMAYEIFTFLVFLLDLLEREAALEAQIAGTGIMFRPLSARIRHVVFQHMSVEMQKIEDGIKRSVPASLQRDQAELVVRTRRMLDEARWRLSRQAGII
jgi:hypothetical protein